MINKKRLICYSILAIVSVVLVFTLLFVPLVHITACDTYKNQIVSETVSLSGYIKKLIFLEPGVDEMYMNATGPLWIAPWAILMNLISVFAGIVVFAVSVFEVATIKANLLNTRKTGMARRLAITCAVFVFIVSVFNFPGLLVTSALSGGYATFELKAQAFVNVGLSVAMFVLPIVAGKDILPGERTKIRNCLGYALTLLASGLGILGLFLPQFTEYFLSPHYLSFYSATTIANDLVHEVQPAGDYPFGLARWVMWILMAVAVIIAIMSIVGLILELVNKE
ncbi:MAG: hypothetical protein IJS68_04110, partial [Clostridia bacterium]|nr:hypothetical protein [Clostridia bacterium]